MHTTHTYVDMYMTLNILKELQICQIQRAGNPTHTKSVFLAAVNFHAIQLMCREMESREQTQFSLSIALLFPLDLKASVAVCLYTSERG